MSVAARFTKFLGRRPSPPPPPEPRTSGESFLTLPPELRNTIYALAAQDCRLDLWGPRSKANGKRLPPSLTLVSRQVRKEYTPLLLATARITIWIRDFHFRPLIRLIGSLYNTELNALRANRHREVILLINTDSVAYDYARSDIDAMDKLIQPLRRWLAHQANAVDGLSWLYMATLVNNRQPSKRAPEFSYVKLSDLLRRLGERVTDILQWELDLICHAGMYSTALTEGGIKFISEGRRAHTR